MIIQRNYTSTLFKIKTRIGTARNYIANKLQDKISKHSKKLNEAAENFNKTKKIQNNNLLEASKNIALELGANTEKKTNTPTQLKKHIGEDNKKEYKIFYNPFQGVESHSHEVGHLINDIKDSRFTRKGRDSKVLTKNNISVITARKLRESTNKKDYGKRNRAIKNSIVSLRNVGKLDTGTGISESFRRMREGNAIVGEELGATRKALKLLKKNGATKDELNLAKTNLGLAAKTYKEGAKIHVLNPIQNKIQIPSRRRK
jgi:hypothetical protein